MREEWRLLDAVCHEENKDGSQVHPDGIPDTGNHGKRKDELLQETVEKEQWTPQERRGLKRMWDDGQDDIRKEVAEFMGRKRSRVGELSELCG